MPAKPAQHQLLVQLSEKLLEKVPVELQLEGWKLQQELVQLAVHQQNQIGRWLVAEAVWGVAAPGAARTVLQVVATAPSEPAAAAVAAAAVVALVVAVPLSVARFAAEQAEPGV